MNSTITHFFGQAMTGQGMKNVYKDIMNEAKAVYLLKGAHGFKVSELLKKLGSYYFDKGAEIEFFHDPLFENTIEGIFIKAPHDILFLQATNPSIEPVFLDTRDHVISLYDCVDEEKLYSNIELFSFTEKKQTYFEHCFTALSNAIHIHDDWEVETRKQMNWKGLDNQYAELVKNIIGEKKLKQSSKLTHRLLGTLTPAGARDTLESITQNLEKRLFIKGYPGTGKSSMMKKLADEALNRGFDVQLVWCGLDSNSVDMVILPELNFCIFDSTEPHVYSPDENRPGDVIFNMAQHCQPTEVEETNIKKIVSQYKAAMAEATRCANLYAEEERKVRELIDDAIIIDEFDKQTAKLFELI
ncbi:nucleotide kinase [Solibacillus sp. CAU 1738]|uniref:nucleotide kinase n=1 Tax=Solibacillus sp. CAU 1738 TaxID=3140363 RepID=UPI00326058FC